MKYYVHAHPVYHKMESVCFDSLEKAESFREDLIEELVEFHAERLKKTWGSFQDGSFEMSLNEFRQEVKEAIDIECLNH